MESKPTENLKIKRVMGTDNESCAAAGGNKGEILGWLKRKDWDGVRTFAL